LTDICLVGAAANRKLVFTLELQTSQSNNVEIAIKRDGFLVFRDC
jgi:hypothetical protein